MINALAHLKPGYGRAISKLKEFIDKGHDPDDTRHGASAGRLGSVSGPTLAELIKFAAENQDEGAPNYGSYDSPDVDQLGDDLSYILIDKAKIGTDILQRIQNVQAQGGIRMYAEVYRWFTETSGLGLVNQAGEIQNPPPAANEYKIAEEIEKWEEKVNRLARYGSEHQLPDMFKMVALRKILVGKIRDCYDLWNAEKYTYDEIIKKVKEQARSKKLDGDAARGKAGIAMGAQQSPGGGEPQRPLEAGQPYGETTPANAFQKGDRKPWKGKGKGKGKGEKGGEGKGKGGQVNLNATSPGPQVVGAQSFSGCFLCGSKLHYARNCPKNTSGNRPQKTTPAAALTQLCGLCVETPNPFSPLREDFEEGFTESEVSVRERSSEPPSAGLDMPSGLRSQALKDQGSICSDPASSPSAEVGKNRSGPRSTRRWSRARSDRANRLASTGSLLVVTTDSINGLEDAAEEWEEVEFMVDSGAGATVVGPEAVKAVQASEPDPSRNYKLADGSLTQDKGKKNFNAQAQDESWWNLNARVTDVDKPLLSVSQMVEGGSTAVFAPGGSYIQCPKGKTMPIELRSNVWFLKMWVPKDQKKPFQGQA